MGFNDRMDEAPSFDLPIEAGHQGARGFEPNDEWLEAADGDQQRDVLRQWFLTRYWDPANETPYNSEEGGYIYVWGGPYDAGDELHNRFGGLVPSEIIDEVVEELQRDGIHEWAPIHTEPDYDIEFELAAFSRSDPYTSFKKRLGEFDGLRVLTADPHHQSLLRPLLYSSLIAAMEAYLADTMSYWVSNDDGVFRRFVENSKEFKDKKLAVSQIFERLGTLKDEVEKYIQTLVWHRLDIIGPLAGAALDIAVPDIGPLMKRILVRHDIVHRGGRTKDGAVVDVREEDLDGLRTEVVDFVSEIERCLEAAFPPQSKTNENGGGPYVDAEF